MKNTQNTISVSNETGTLRKVLIHSPDSGLGKVVPSKAQDWLFEDIVHLDTIRAGEYDYYVKLLLYFLDPEKIKGKLAAVDHPDQGRNFYQPGKKEYFKSDRVLELQFLLMEVLKDPSIKSQMVASVCALESCSFKVQQELIELGEIELAKVFLNGVLKKGQMIFPPVPNFIFTRDIGIVINQHILLNKPKKEARRREALIAKYIFFNHPVFEGLRSRIIELNEPQNHFLLPVEDDQPIVTIEGGDVMMVAPNHVFIGVSERTSREAASQATQILFEKSVVEKVTIVRIPNKRDYMHIDTVFTQIKKNVWVLLGEFSNIFKSGQKENILDSTLGLCQQHTDGFEVIQFINKSSHKSTHNSSHNFSHGNHDIQVKRFETVEDLLIDVSVTDLGCRPEDVHVVLSGNNEFPFDVREQWTDSCNLLALRDGIAVGYDRNDLTLGAFKEIGFDIVKVEDLLQDLENDKMQIDNLRDTIIVLPSAELSRARGGFHCMSMPLLRSNH